MVDAEKEEPIGFFHHAFERRPGEQGVSTTWVEYFKGDYEAQLHQVRNVLSAYLSMNNNHRLAVVQIGAIKRAGIEHGRHLDVVHRPIPLNPAHAEIEGIELDEDPELLAAIADEAELELAVVD